MTKTLVEDGFDEGEHGQGMEVFDPYFIVFGATGWVDTLDKHTIYLLEAVGAIVEDNTASTANAKVYVSVAGKFPQR